MKLLLFSVSIFIFCCAVSCERDPLPPDEENLYMIMEIDGEQWEAEEHPNDNIIRKKISASILTDSNEEEVGVVFYGEAFWPNTANVNSATELVIKGFSVQDTMVLHTSDDSTTSSILYYLFDENQVPVDFYVSTENEENWIYYSMIDWSTGYAEGSFQSEVYNQSSDTLLITFGTFRGNFNF